MCTGEFNRKKWPIYKKVVQQRGFSESDLEDPESKPHKNTKMLLYDAQ